MWLRPLRRGGGISTALVAPRTTFFFLFRLVFLLDDLHGELADFGGELSLPHHRAFLPRKLIWRCDAVFRVLSDGC